MRPDVAFGALRTERSSGWHNYASLNGCWFLCNAHFYNHKRGEYTVNRRLIIN